MKCDVKFGWQNTFIILVSQHHLDLQNRCSLWNVKIAISHKTTGSHCRRVKEGGMQLERREMLTTIQQKYSEKYASVDHTKYKYNEDYGIV